MIVTRREVLEGAAASPIAVHPSTIAWPGGQPAELAPRDAGASRGTCDGIVVDAAVMVSAAWPIVLASLATGPAANVRAHLRAIDSDIAAAFCAAGPALAAIVRVETLLAVRAQGLDLKAVALMPAALCNGEYVLAARADAAPAGSLRMRLQAVLFAIAMGAKLARDHRHILLRTLLLYPGCLPPRLCEAVLRGHLRPALPQASGWFAACNRAASDARLRSAAAGAFTPIALPLTQRVATWLAVPARGNSDGVQRMK